MNDKPLNYALIAGGLAAFAWLVSGIRFQVGFETVLGYGVVTSIVAMLVSEYRHPVKKLIGK